MKPAKKTAWTMGLAVATATAVVAVTVAAVIWRTAARQPLPHVVLAVFDTTRADHLPTYGYARNTAPNIAALATRALVFERAFATAPWTLPSHASLFTGRSPNETNVGWQQTRLPGDLPTMAESFARAGYFTAGISQNPILNPTSGFARGFRRWTNIAQGETRAALANVLAEHPAKQPLFLFLNLIAPHLPYNPPMQHRWRFIGSPSERMRVLSQAKWNVLLRLHSSGALSPGDLDLLAGLYDGEIHWADSEFGEVLAALNEAGLGAHTIVVAASDHGENIGDHDLFDHQLSAYNSLLHVLLVIYAPGRISPGRVNTPVSLQNLWKTLAEMAGLPGREDIPGFSLLATEARAQAAPVLSECERAKPILDGLTKCCPAVDPQRYDRELVAAQGQRFKLILSSNRKHELYDLQSDPGETRNLFGTPYDAETAGAVRRLRNAAQSRAPRPGHEEVKIPAADLERLRALGYIAGPD